MFDSSAARSRLDRYRRQGVGGSTQILVDGLIEMGVDDATVLDIGGGVGIVGFELLAAGAGSVLQVDASAPSVAEARAEAARRGLGDRASYRQGDFVALARDVEPADVVVLDRVICCYGDWRSLVDRSLERSRRLYGYVIPAEHWWTRAAIAVGNAWLRLTGHTFRGYVHPEADIDQRVRESGFVRRTHRRGWIWRTSIYERSG